MRDLVKLYFTEHNIVNHHLESFNDFIALEDGKRENRMQKIVDDLRIAPEDTERGIIRLDPEKTDGRNIYIRIGRPKDRDGRVDATAEPTINVGAPYVREADGS